MLETHALDVRDPAARLPDDDGATGRQVVSRLALIGNFLPRRCGIATFTTDIYNAMKTRFPDVAIDIWAMDDSHGAHVYPPEVTGTIAQDERVAYSIAAQAIEASGADALWLQHEYGIFGGPAGDHILHLLQQVTIPVMTHVHTVLAEPDAHQRRVMNAIVARSDRLIVMAEGARAMLIEHYGARPEQIAVIAHGIPDRPFRPSAPMKARLGFGDRPVVLTFGLLSPGKGIETMIEAMRAVVARIPHALYVVLGATHPHLIAREGEAYRERLAAQVERLGLGGNVRFIDAFVETGDLLDYLEAADIYATPYLNPAQVTSGTLAYAVGLGKAIISTPYVHAREILADDHGRLVGFGDADGFARAIVELLGDRDALESLRMRAYSRGRTMIWPRLAEAALDAIAPIAGRKRAPVRPGSRSGIRVGHAAIDRMTDGVGMLQHSVYGMPDRAHGYCVDDNARALMLMMQPAIPAALRARLTPVYASFVDHAWNDDAGLFRNFMSYDRRWLESIGSDDSNGRCLWALGVARTSADAETAAWARDRFDRALAIVDRLDGPRAKAFAMLGAAEALRADPGDDACRALIARFGAAIAQLLDAVRRPDWAWFEIVLAYDNCRLPEALIRGGRAIGDEAMVNAGLETLAWIIDKQTTERGLFRPAGHESFGRPYADPLPFDQQPVEAWATIDACEAALAETGDARWKAHAAAAWNWFFGANDLGVALADVETGDCFDGLTPHGVNRNRGAESVLSLQLAACRMQSMSGFRDGKSDLRLAAA